MTEINEMYEVRAPFKGWPVREAHSLKDASEMILGSPYWNIPDDRYVVLDKNDTYSLLAQVVDEKVSRQNRYLAVNMDLMEHSVKIT